MLSMSRGKRARRKEAARRRPGAVGAAHGGLSAALSGPELIHLRQELHLPPTADLNDLPPLFAAVVLNKLDFAKRLLEENHPADCFGPGGETALQWCVSHGRVEAALALAGGGATAGAVDGGGNHVPLTAATATAWEEADCTQLWDHLLPFDMDHRNQAGYSLLHYAAKKQWTEAVSWLAGHGAQVDCASRRLVTPLMMAASKNLEDTVRALLAAGADPTSEDERCCTALCYGISYVMQKRLPLPNHTVNALAEQADLDVYLKRRLWLLVEPPAAPGWPDTVAGVLADVIAFAVRHLPQGLNLLLRHRVFARMSQALRRHLCDEPLCRALCAALLPLCLYCSCCYGAGAAPPVCERRVATLFVKHGVADACRALLDRQLGGCALLPLALLLPASVPGRAWLRDNQHLLETHYSQQLPHLAAGLPLDKRHAALLAARLAAFHRLWQALQLAPRDTSEKEGSFPVDALVGEGADDGIGCARREFDEDADSSSSEEADPDHQLLAEDEEEPVVEGNRDGLEQGEPHRSAAGDQNDETRSVKRETVGADGDSQSPATAATGRQLTGDLADVSLLEALLRSLVRWYQRKWQREARRGYPGHGAAQEDFDKMTQVIQAAERSYVRKLCRRWRSVRERLLGCPLAEARRTAANHLLALLEAHLTAVASAPRPPATLRTKLNLDRCIAEYVAGPEEVKEKKGCRAKSPERSEEMREAEDAVQVVAPPPPPPPPGFAQQLPQPQPPFCPDTPGRWKAALSLLSGLSDAPCPAGVRLGGMLLAAGGSFGPVELGLPPPPAPPLAVKRLPPELGPAVSQAVCRLSALRHSHLLPYALCCGGGAAGNTVLLAAPLCECNLGELIAVLKADGRLQQRAHGLVRQFLSGLCYLHTQSKPTVHGNLKPSNVLVDEKGVLKLADFGIQQLLYQSSKPPNSSVIWWARETYIMYEHSRQMSCSIMSDIQVAGMLVHFILTGGTHPFGTDTCQIIQNVRKGISMPTTANCEANDLISWMLLRDPGQRPSIKDVLRHVYFWGSEKKWKFLLACTGIMPDGKTTSLPLPDFFTCLEKQAAHHQIKGDWVSVVQTSLPEIAPVGAEYSSTPVGLLQFMRLCLEGKQKRGITMTVNLQQFFVSAFPELSLTIYRLVEETEWLKHPALVAFVSDQ